MVKKFSIKGVEYEVVGEDGEHKHLKHGDTLFWFANGHKFKRVGRGFQPARGGIPGQPRKAAGTAKAELKTKSKKTISLDDEMTSRILEGKAKLRESQNLRGANGLPELLMANFGDVTIREFVRAVQGTFRPSVTAAPVKDGDVTEALLAAASEQSNRSEMFSLIMKGVESGISAAGATLVFNTDAESTVPFTSFHHAVILEAMKAGMSPKDAVDKAYVLLGESLKMHKEFVAGLGAAARPMSTVKDFPVMTICDDRIPDLVETAKKDGMQAVFDELKKQGVGEREIARVSHEVSKRAVRHLSVAPVAPVALEAIEALRRGDTEKYLQHIRRPVDAAELQRAKDLHEQTLTQDAQNGDAQAAEQLAELKSVKGRANGKKADPTLPASE